VKKPAGLGGVFQLTYRRWFVSKCQAATAWRMSAFESKGSKNLGNRCDGVATSGV